MSYVLLFSEIKPQHKEIVGKKAFSLASLYSSHNVPPGFVITTNSYEFFLEKTGLKEKIDALLKSIKYDSLQSTANEIQKAIIETEIPLPISTYILETYAALGVGKKVSAHELVTAQEKVNAAVRKSSIDDTEQKDFPKFVLLNIQGEKEILKAVKILWAAQFKSKNIKARSEAGLLEIPKTGVIIQKMINAETSAKVHSYNPKTKDPSEIYIKAITGLGSGFEFPGISHDIFIIDKSSLDVKEKFVSEQLFKIALNKKTGNTKKYYLKDGRKQKLNDKEAQEIARITKKITVALGKEQIIDFSLEQNQFYILEAEDSHEKLWVVEKTLELPKHEIITEKEKPLEEKASPSEQYGRIETEAKEEETTTDIKKEDEILYDRFDEEAEKLQEPLEKETLADEIEIIPKEEHEDVREKVDDGVVDYDEGEDLKEEFEKEDVKVYEDEPFSDAKRKEKPRIMADEEYKEEEPQKEENEDDEKPKRAHESDDDEEYDDSIFSSIKKDEGKEEER